MTLGPELGPLQGLAGTWEGNEGVDVAYSHDRSEIISTPFRERLTLNAFGPVANGPQVLYGLDYRTAAWREGQETPFHTEVGYWLWDARSEQVMRCFMVPRGSTLLAGGTAAPGDTSFTLRAEVGSETYGILSNPYLADAARTVAYEVTVTVEGDEFTYRSCTTMEHARCAEILKHTDENRLRRAAS